MNGRSGPVVTCTNPLNVTGPAATVVTVTTGVSPGPSTGSSVTIAAVAVAAAGSGGMSYQWYLGGTPIGTDAPVQRYASPDVPSFPFNDELEAQLMPNVAGIVHRARELAEY